MDDLFKFLLMALFVLVGGAGMFGAYRRLNRKIVGSRNGWELLGYALALLLVCAAVFLGVLYLFVRLFTYLS